MEAGDSNKADGPGWGREGHTMCRLSVEWGKNVSRDKDQERPCWERGICDGYLSTRET